jgi:RNA polymerase sigma-70 factor (ECF subfamily)
VVTPESDDRELVTACQAGDRQAFRLLYERHSRKAFAVALRVLRNEEDAHDVVQEAFVKVHRYLVKFEGQSSFYTWLYRIVVNLSIDHVRRGKRRRDVEFKDELRHDESVAGSGDASVGHDRFRAPDSKIEDVEIWEAFKQGLEELSDTHRKVLEMREIQGLKYAEIAETMGCSKGTIMSRLFHARKNMQKVMRSRGIKMPSETEGAPPEIASVPGGAEVVAP